jgi:aminopeptidase N
VHINGTQVPLA